MKNQKKKEVQVIIPNMNRRFSGITSTVVQVLPFQAKEFNIVTVGYELVQSLPRLSWLEIICISLNKLPEGASRIFHARRNIEMLAGVVLKKVFRCKIHLIFTSTAQREHSRWTRFLYKRMDTLISTSPMAASFLKRRPDAIIPHGIDISKYYAAKNRAKAWAEGGLPGKYGIGIFGRVREQKGIREFIESMCEVLPLYPDYTAVVVGETTPKHEKFLTEMQSLIAEKGLKNRVFWLGKLPFDEISGWFRRMSLVVCASHNEGYGLTCLEAMASRVPVVATRAGAWELIIRDGVDGMLVPCGETKAMQKAIQEILKCPDKLEKMGENAEARVHKRFSIKEEAGALNSVYASILRNV